MIAAGALASLALLRVHVLVVGLPGYPVLRLRAEAAVRARSWVVTTAPADADLLLVCGTQDPEVAAAVDALWWRVPAPRARRTIGSAEELEDALDSAARVLGDRELQRRAAEHRGPAPVATPEGAFGPLGVAWPPGLVVECATGPGGRIAAVGVRRIGPAAEEDAPPGLLAAADAARLLRLTRWEAPAHRLDRVVDLLLAGAPPERVRSPLRRVAALVGRSASYRWSAGADVPAVDLRQRVLALLTAAIDGTDAPTTRRRLIGARVGDVPAIVAVTEAVGG
ncbi:hypothetical protein [Amnibacterium kyonggiense]|uniref:Uncharacterized protein n=1 Tax=Amnibacterium kyonggiense TaxID=595671 RepID=A0A4R7FSR6_9MICO|nr:hypothetical protein [Amnibacterium kyonggiense]TDS80719.1 hypothetical protein CLV52_1286 [Amnibacterium kyonggiense]